MAISRSINFTKASANIALLPALETVDLSAPLLVAANIIRTLNPEVPLSVEPLPAEMCAFVVTDRHWLGENALCLLSNAVKYSDGGPIRINVTLRGQNASWRMAKLANTAVSSGLTLSSEDPTADDDPDQAQASNPRQFVRVSVIDSGIGVRPESRQHLFQPFGQTQRRAGGTGLGLYSLRKRMEALHGACGVCRRADGQRGSEFWFEFPYRPDHGVTASASAAASAPTAVPSSTGPSRHHAAAHQDKPPTEALTDSTAAPVLSIAADHHVSVECALPVSWAVRRSPCLGGGTKSKSEALRILIGTPNMHAFNSVEQR